MRGEWIGLIKQKLFNNKFEVSMRVMLLLFATNEKLDFEKIIHLDFMTIYAKKFKFSEENLNGDCVYIKNLFYSQRPLYSSAINFLLREGLISFSASNDGFKYFINESGIKISISMESDYSKEYLKTAKKINTFFKNLDIKDIKLYFNKLKED